MGPWHCSVHGVCVDGWIVSAALSPLPFSLAGKAVSDLSFQLGLSDLEVFYGPGLLPVSSEELWRSRLSRLRPDCPPVLQPSAVGSDPVHRGPVHHQQRPMHLADLKVPPLLRHLLHHLGRLRVWPGPDPHAEALRPACKCCRLDQPAGDVHRDGRDGTQPAQLCHRDAWFSRRGRRPGISHARPGHR